MSPASKTKSKDKKSGKEPQKASSKPSAPANGGSGISASAYNPLLGTFHTLETSLSSPAGPIQSNGRFRNIDETDEHPGNSVTPSVEYDSVSNNDSWSGESEEHREKASNGPGPTRLESIPGADNDKREKIRQKNEKKHQRQKERRAQELHERCSGYLMSRKLEALAQQLVAMGFSSERATMALILNEGRVEESVNWLFESGEDANNDDNKHKTQTLDGGGNLKIDIAEELAHVTEMEITFKCSKQEVERAIVACEGDLEKAAETLRVQKQDQQQQPSATPKLEEASDPPSTGNSQVRPQKLNPSTSTPSSMPITTIQQRRDERDFNYTKASVPAVASSSEATGVKNVQSLRRIPPQQMATLAEKRWPSGVPSNSSSVSYSSLASPLQVSATPPKTPTRYASVGSEYKNIQAGPMREPVIMMQRAQSVNAKQALSSSSPPSTAAGWFPNNVETMKPNELFTGSLSPSPSPSPSPNPSLNNFSPGVNNLSQLQHLHNRQADYSPGTNWGNGSRSRLLTSPTLAAASSLGLFSGLGSTSSSGLSSQVDWNAGGPMPQLDYKNVDWSLDQMPLSSRFKGLSLGLTSPIRNNTNIYGPNTTGAGTMQQSALRLGATARGGGSLRGLQGGGVPSPGDGSSREWTSPFEGNDLFSVPRRFVSSNFPSLYDDRRGP